MYSSIWVLSAVYLNLDALLNKKNHNYYSYHVKIENENVPAEFQVLHLEVQFLPFVLLMDPEIKLHLCGFLACVPTFSVVLE